MNDNRNQNRIHTTPQEGEMLEELDISDRGSSKATEHSVGWVTPDPLVQSLTHCGRVTQICVFNTVKLGTSASSP